jgi:sec-independent protein translocase protein TatA
MPNLGVPELLIIALVIFLLFGATRLPNAARSLGRSMRIFKSEMDEMKTDGDKKELAKKQAPTAEQQQAQDLAQPKSEQPNEHNA